MRPSEGGSATTTGSFKYYDPRSGSFSYGGQIPKDDKSNNFKYYDPRTGTYSYGGEIPKGTDSTPAYARPEVKDTVAKLTGGRTPGEIAAEMNAAYAAEAAKVQSAIQAQMRAQRNAMLAEQKYQRAQAKAARNSAYDNVAKTFERYGLNGKEVRKALKGLAENAYLDSNTLVERIRETQTWSNRFGAVSKARQKAGLSYLNEGEIVAMEDGYRKVMSDAAMPKGFYDKYTDFQKWISQGVSVDEIGERVALAENAIANTDPEYVKAMKELYGVKQSDLVAYMLDRKRGTEVLTQQLQAVEIGASALETGISINKTFTENLVDKGVTGQIARQVFDETAQTSDDWKRLAGLNRETITDQNLIEMNLGLDPETGKKVKRLASQERSRWSGVGGSGNAFGGSTSGSY